MWIVTDVRALLRGILVLALSAALIYLPGHLRAKWNQGRGGAALEAIGPDSRPGMEKPVPPKSDAAESNPTEAVPPQTGTAVPPEPDTPKPAPLKTGLPTVIIDAGHGGEDGGAVSPDGVPESGINLDITLRLGDLLRALGQPVRFTRETETSLGDPSLPTVRQRKNDDLRRRVALVNGTENGVLLSVHQNSLPSSPVTHGAQVFWNRMAGGEALAEAVQAALNGTVNRGNEKKARPMGEGVYLMSHAEVPAALVECGFLSNASDAELLQTPEYRARLALAAAEGFFYWRDTQIPTKPL